MNKQERIEALAKEMSMEGESFRYYIPLARIAVEFMDAQYAELVDAAENLYPMIEHGYTHQKFQSLRDATIKLNNLKEPSHD